MWLVSFCPAWSCSFKFFFQSLSERFFHDSVSYEFTLEVNNNHYGNINVGFDEGQLKFYLDTNKWETDIKVTDKKVDIIDELDQVVCSIDLKPNVKDMVTIDVKENHNQLLALMYCFVVMAVKEYLDK